MISRRISLEKDFMDWHKDDIMYAYLLNLAEYRKQDNTLWLSKNTYYDNKQDIMNVCEYSSCTSLRSNMKKWLDSGLIIEGEIEHKGKKYSAYIFKNYDKNGKYQLVNLGILRRLMDAKSKHSIQIYTYLLSKYKFKKDYDFTLKELRQMLGYAETSRNQINHRIINILQDLQSSGYIDYEPVNKVLSVEGKTVIIPLNTLTFVAKEEQELPEFKNVNG